MPSKFFGYSIIRSFPPPRKTGNYFRNEKAAVRLRRRRRRPEGGFRDRRRLTGVVQAGGPPRALGGQERVFAGIPEAPALHGRRRGVPVERQRHFEVSSRG